MRSLVRRARPASRDDQGFTLIEVVVAIVLLTMVSVAMLGLFVRAMKGTAGLDRKQAAVAVAGQAIELARSVSAVQDPSVPSKLISGRTSTAVDSQWAAASAAAAWDSSQTDKASDASGATTPVVPLTSTSTVAGVTYTAYTLVGTCWRPATGGDCVKAVNKVAGSVQMYRLITLVTWWELAGACTSACQSYTVATLIDPRKDPSFNINATNAAWPAAPIVVDVTATTTMNTPVTVDLTSAVTSGATPLVATVGTNIQNGTASVLPNTLNVTITPATGFFSGSDVSVPFTLTDPYGQSDTGTLKVHVQPPLTATSFAISVNRGGTKTIDLSGKISGGSGTLTYSVSGSLTAQANITISGAVVTYTRKNSSNTSQDSFTYTVGSSTGEQSTGTVSVTVT